MMLCSISRDDNGEYKEFYGDDGGGHGDHESGDDGGVGHTYHDSGDESGGDGNYGGDDYSQR